MCRKPFHVRCAIKRGLITAHEIMAMYQCNPETGRIYIYCSKHTKVKRNLPDVDDMVSCGTDFMSTITGMTGAPSAIANEPSLDINLPFNQSFSNSNVDEELE